MLVQLVDLMMDGREYDQFPSYSKLTSRACFLFFFFFF